MKISLSAHPGRDASRRFGSLMLTALTGLSLATASLADGSPLSDSHVAPAAHPPAAVVIGGPEGADLQRTPGDPGELRHTAWHSEPVAETEVKRWVDEQIKLLETGEGDNGAGTTPRTGSLGKRDGDLDPTVDIYVAEPGIHRVAIDGGNTMNDRAVGISQRADGKIYLVGQSGAAGAPTRIAIARLTSHGQRDPDFGSGGVQIVTVGNPQLTLVKAIGVTRNNYERFYILAQDRELASNHEFALLCLRTPTVGSNLPFETCPGFGSPTGNIIRYYNFAGATGCASNHDVPRDMFLDDSTPDSRRFYLAGSAQRQFNSCTDTDFAVLRVDMNGALDTTFNTTGRVLWGIPPVVGGGSWTASAYAVARRADGRVVLGGGVGGGANLRAVAAQFTSAGAIDNGFCADGVSTCDSPASHRNGIRAWGSDNDTSRVRALTPTFGSGLYVARWRDQNLTSTVGRLTRMDSTGGCLIFCNEATMYPTPGTRTVPESMTFHPGPSGTDGQIVVANYNYPDGTFNESRIIVYRFNANTGSNTLGADTLFSSGPVPQRQDITFPGSGATGFVRNARPSMITVDRQGRYLIAGHAAFSASDQDFGFARLQRDVIFIDGFNR